MDDESCMSDHDTFMHLHYKHDNEHFLPFVLHFQTVVQAYLYGKITQHLVLSPLCLFLHGGEGDQGILVLCPHMVAAQFISSEYRDVVSMMDGTFACPLAFISFGCEEEGWIIQALDKVHNVSMVHYCGIVCPDHEMSQSHIS